jgi:hypothetical protein
MAVFLYGSLLFLTGLVVHLIVWRIRLPRRQTKGLLIIFLVTLVFGCVLYDDTVPTLNTSGADSPFALAEFFQLSLFFLSLTMAYLITYSAVEADSPSLVIVRKISEAGTGGLKKDLLAREIDESVLILPRLKDLIVDKMAVIEHGRYRLKTKGVIMARLFKFYRRLMGAGMGG